MMPSSDRIDRISPENYDLVRPGLSRIRLTALINLPDNIFTASMSCPLQTYQFPVGFISGEGSSADYASGMHTAEQQQTISLQEV